MDWIDRSFVLVDAASSVREVRRRLALHPNAHWLIVRRVVGARVYWYAFPVEQALARMQPHGPAEAAERALDLHEWRSVEARTRADVRSGAAQPGDVLLRAPGVPAGVFTPPMQRAARPPAGAGPGVGIRAPEEVEMEEGPRGGAGAPEAAPRPRRGAPRRPVKKAKKFAAKKAARPARRGGAKRAAAPRGRRAPKGASAPFHAWPDVQAPDTIHDGESFDLEVGFAREQVAGVVGAAVDLAAAPDLFDVTLVITAPGFRTAKGWRHTLRVNRDAPETSHVTLRLTAAAGAWPRGEDTVHRVIGVVYEYRGEVCGMAQRPIVIVRRGATLEPAAVRDAKSFASQAPRRVPLWVREGAVRADLTVALTRYDGNAARSNFVWSFHSPHDVPLPKPVPVKLSDDAASFARAITKDIVRLGDEASPLLAKHVRGAGKRIADRVPKAMWEALAAVAKAPGVRRRVPDVLLLTEEWSIPWELAMMAKPRDAKAPPFLGAQVNLGRWILGEPATTAQPEPALDVRRMVVLYGDYPKDQELPEAIVERDRLVKRERAVAVPLKDAQVDHVLDGAKPAGGGQLIHFACHGVGDPTDPGNTHLVLESGAPLTDDMLRDAAVGEKQHPFLFLNACEAGTAGDELDMASGFVGSAIQAGFRGCVGALWNVASDTAREVALDFYDRTLKRGESVASALRATRGRFVARRGKAPDDTYLAYVFYGHPALRLRRPRAGRG